MNEEQNDFEADEQTEQEAQTCCDSMDDSCSLEAFFNPSFFDSQALFLEQLYIDDAHEQYLSLLFAQNYLQPNSAQNQAIKPSMLQFDFNELERSLEGKEKPKNSLSFGQFYLQNLQFSKTQQAKQEEKKVIVEKQHLNQIKGSKDEMKLNKCELQSDSILKRRLNEIGNSNNNNLSVSALSINPMKGNYMGHLKVQSMDSTSRNSGIWNNNPKKNYEYSNGKQQYQNSQQQTKSWKILEGQWRGHREDRKRTPKNNNIYYSQPRLATPEAYRSNLSLLLEDSQPQNNQKSILGLSSPGNLQMNVVTPLQQRFLFTSKAKQIDEQLRTAVPQKSIRGAANSQSPLSLSQSSSLGSSFAIRPPSQSQSSSLFNIKGIMKESIETVSKLRFQLIDSCRSIKSNISAKDESKIIKNVQANMDGKKDTGIFSDFQVELAGEQNESNVNNLSQSNIVFFKAPQFNKRENQMSRNIQDNQTAMKFQALLQNQRQQQNQHSLNGETTQLQKQQTPIIRNLRTRKSAAFERIFSSHLSSYRNAVGQYDHVPSSTQSARLKNNYQVQEQISQLPYKDSIVRIVNNGSANETATTADDYFQGNFQGKKGHFKKKSSLNQVII